MTDNDLRQMIQRVITEVKSLRSQVSEFQPRAEAYAAITQILGMMPQPNQQYSEDIVWKLERELEKLAAQPADEQP